MDWRDGGVRGGARANIVDLLTMRELVEGAAALAACAFFTALPAIVRVLCEVVFRW